MPAAGAATVLATTSLPLIVVVVPPSLDDRELARKATLKRPSAGLTFGQFVDCVGRCAIVGLEVRGALEMTCHIRIPPLNNYK